jgi:enoyl-CoA hydratase/carnithine racemase
VRVAKPRVVKADCHLAASTATPSDPPRRKESRTAVGMGDTVLGRRPPMARGVWGDPTTVIAVPEAAEVSGDDELLVERRGPVLTLTINRPARRNAMTWDVIAGLRAGIAQAKDDPSVRVVVLTGAGEEAFCAGADLSGMVPSGEGASDDPFSDHHRARGWLAALFEELWELGKPTVARVQGWAMAGGFGLALACDMVVASERARFGAPELNVGLWPYMVTVPLLRSMTPKRALELMLTSRVVDAAEAERIGFVNQVVAPEELDAATSRLCDVLASKPPGVMKLGRDSFYAVVDSAASAALPYLHALLTVTSQTGEAAEGIAAFAEKRPPSWQVPGPDPS